MSFNLRLHDRNELAKAVKGDRKPDERPDRDKRDLGKLRTLLFLRARGRGRRKLAEHKHDLSRAGRLNHDLVREEDRQIIEADP